MKITINHRLFKWLTLLWGIVIFSVSSMPHLSVPKLRVDFRLDYVFHFGVYFVLGILIVFWKVDEKLVFNAKKHIFVIVLAYVFVVIDETHQLWVSGRTFAWQDMLSNALGISLAFLSCPIFLRAVVLKKQVFKS